LNPVEKARISDATQVRQLVNYYADRDEMLPRPLSEIYENIRDYFVVRQDERVIACAALHVNWADLAEIKSVAVVEDNKRQGIGTQIIEACVNEARQLGISRIFCLTYQTVFFKKLGFYQIDKMELPHKVWSECYLCPKFPNCDEIALIYHLESGV
jgi:amino-acid N-acetyltransferase